LTTKFQHPEDFKKGKGILKKQSSSCTHDHDHSHDHKDKDNHGHSHGVLGHHHSSVKNIKIAFLLNFGFAIVEIFGGLWTGSVAILADAVHDLGDAMALAMAWFFEKISVKKPTSKYSYGYRRLSLLSAILTCSILMVGAAIVIAQAVPRLINPVTPKLEGMLFFAALGIAVNGFAAWKLIRGTSINEKVVSWHLIEDVFGWVTVLIGTLVMMVFDLPIIDPLLSIFFTLYILWNVLKNMKKITSLFLQAVPEGVDLKELRQQIKNIKGVIDTHDAHLWSLDGESHVLTVHVVVVADTGLDEAMIIKSRIRDIMSAAGNIHVTIEIERQDEQCPDFHCGEA
jgi:cobalt-zinc-cadmium efflux system protein